MRRGALRLFLEQEGTTPVTLNRYSANKMLHASTETLVSQLQGRFILVFDDGEVETNANETTFSSYAWDLIRLYPDTPLRLKHHVRSVIGEGRITADTHRKLLGRAVWDIRRTYMGRPDAPTKETLARLVTEKNNELYNAMCVSTEEDAASLDYIDAVQIMEHPPVKAVLDSLTPDDESIERAYAALRHAMLKDPALENNAISRLVRSGLIKMDQVLQCLGPRGSITDIGSDIFSQPVMRGYAAGMRDIYSSLVESRSASKSLLFSEGPLQKSEYAARKLQLVGMAVERLYDGDCGSQNYLQWKLKGERRDADGNVYMKSDLAYMEGVWYLDEETNTLKQLQKTDTHLIGKSLKIRNAVAGCAHKDVHGVCSVCFGGLADSIVEKTNLGHQCCAIYTTKKSQKLLSNKHLETSSKAQKVVIPPNQEKFFRASLSGNSYLLTKEMANKKLRLVFAEDAAPTLTDIFFIDNIKRLPLFHVSELKDLTLYVTHETSKGPVVEPTTLEVSVSKRLASFTYQALEYIKEKNWTYDEAGRYVVDFSDWDVDLPLLTLPLRHYNMSDHDQITNAMIESSKAAARSREYAQTPEALLEIFYETVNSKLDVHFSNLSIVVYGAMVVDIDNGNFGIVRADSPTKTMGVTAETVPNRSLGPAMDYEAHEHVLTHPASFFHDNRPSSVMDVFVMPKEAVQDRSYPSF